MAACPGIGRQGRLHRWPVRSAIKAMVAAFAAMKGELPPDLGCLCWRLRAIVTARVFVPLTVRGTLFGLPCWTDSPLIAGIRVLS